MRVNARDALSPLVPPVLSRAAISLVRLVFDQVASLRIRGQDKLHLACGKNVLPGWANVDLEGPAAVIKLDLTRPLPAADSSMSCVYCEHFIEHIAFDAATRLLRECHRVLKPGGVLRISTPNLAHLVAKYQEGKLDDWADIGWVPQSPARLLNEAMRLWGHQFVYDALELESLLRGAGFERIDARAWRQSPHAALADLECRPYKGELIYECTR